MYCVVFLTELAVFLASCARIRVLKAFSQNRRLYPLKGIQSLSFVRNRRKRDSNPWYRACMSCARIHICVARMHTLELICQGFFCDLLCCVLV